MRKTEKRHKKLFQNPQAQKASILFINRKESLAKQSLFLQGNLSGEKDG